MMVAASSTVRIRVMSEPSTLARRLGTGKTPAPPGWPEPARCRPCYGRRRVRLLPSRPPVGPGGARRPAGVDRARAADLSRRRRDIVACLGHRDIALTRGRLLAVEAALH